MPNMDRRTFLQIGAAAAGHFVMAVPDSRSAERPGRKFTMNLNVGQIGVKATPWEVIKLAKKYGYGSVTPPVGAVQRYSQAERDRLVSELKSNGLVWGAGALRPFFDQDEATFKEKLKTITATARLYQQMGATRCFTWMMSSSSTLTYRENFDLHARRVREVATVLADHGVRLGLEYLGTAVLAVRNKYPFIRTSAETKELIAEVGLTQVGIALDSWHWFQAGETEDDIRKLTRQDVVTADICDAPAGIARRQMPDSPRRLPCTTGVIDVGAFLQGLVKIGYDGPVGMEPFDRSLRTMSTEQAMTTATNAMTKAFALIE